MATTQTDFDFNARPIQVTYVEIWRDGGTLSVVFTDRDGREFRCCIGGALNADSGELFAGQTHPSLGKVTLVAPQEPLWAAVVTTIEEHLNRDFSKDELTTLSERDGSRGFVSGTISDEQREAWLLIDALKRMKTRASDRT